ENYTQSILDTLQNKNQNIALYSPSGAGKTSLLRAKICTRLEKAGWEVWVSDDMRSEPPQELLGSIANRISFLVNWNLNPDEPPDPRRSVADQLQAMPRYGSSGKRVLILDQFEDFFTHHKDRYDDRVGFFADLLNALERDPALRLVVAFRQEFLASFQELTEGSEHLFTPVHLKRMNDKEACEVITRPVAPYATFAPGVAEGIVKLLRSRPDGGRAEFIELVHLQIVCKELWLNLEEGITEIQQDHVDRAAGGRGTLKRFVENVVQSFVHKAVEDVAAEAGVDPEVIHFGLLKFVNKSGGRVTLPMDFSRDRTGRLSNKVVKLLADNHLLRAETRGGEHWYELSHDLLVEPVAQHRNPKLSKLLAVTDLLTTLLDRAREECEAADRAREKSGLASLPREERAASDRPPGEAAARHDRQLTGYFGAHRDLLDECEAVYDPQLLDARDEAELVFRASLACAWNMDLWSTRLGRETFLPVRDSVLRDAVTRASEPAVRGNAVRVLAEIHALGRELVPVALRDPDEGVRDRAAATLAALDDPELYTEVVGALAAGEASSASTRTLAAVLAEAENRGVTSHREPFARLPHRSHRRIRTASRRLRLRRAAPSLVYVVLCAAILAGLGTGMFKGVPTAFNIGITQLTGSLFMGAYQGFVAGTSFGALISLSLAVHYAISARQKTVSYFRPVLPILLGIVSGALSGFVVDLIILGVYSGPTMTGMHWISNERVMDHRIEMLEQVFFKSHYGWCFVVSGALLGCGVAMVGNRLRNWDDWLPVLKQDDELTGLRQAATVIKRIARVALPHAWPIALALTVAAPLAALPVSPLPFDPDYHWSSSATANVAKSPAGGAPEACSCPAGRSGNGRRSDLVPWDVAADCGCQVTGGFGVIVGMGFGIVLIRRGVHIRRRRRA
ncbi:MAG TPA: hypothetical protein VGD80_11995, partial [Kofleriaceae bacterium]